MRHLIDQQGACVRPRPSLTGRHRAPSGAPACTSVHAGGEGTPSRTAVPDAFLMLLDVERAEAESVAYMRGLARAAFGSPSLEPLMTALVSVEYQWRETVERIRQRGGMLLIGGAV